MFDSAALKAKRLMVISSKATIVQEEHHEHWACIQYHDSQQRLCCIFFSGRSAKPTWHLYFKDSVALAARVLSSVEAARQQLEHKATIKDERCKPHSLLVGNILVSSWGYEQTNVDWYIVTEVVSQHTVKIAPIGKFSSDMGEGFTDRGHSTPNPELITGEPFSKRASSDNYIRLSSFQSAHLWDGRPKYWSSYA